MNPGRPPKRRPAVLWNRVAMGREASAGYDLAANIIFGLGLGWIAQRFFPQIKPWGYGVGILLGSISGFYQLFKQQGRPPQPKGPAVDEPDHEPPR